jgi:hypothetical protein
MNQTFALLVDAYRELNARKMFWISLIISAAVIAVFALLGLGDNGLTLLGMDLRQVKPAPFWYKWLFSGLIVGVWAEKAAMVLALISTASIFPELMAGGAIDLYLSKPIGRLRLFVTKYLGGLLFVVLQVTVFTVGCYVVFGLRAGQWRTSLFLLIPLATLLFTYLFAVCVLVGVITRSTMAAILVTCLFWVLCIIGNMGERFLYQFRTAGAAQVRAYERQAQQADADLLDMKRNPSILNAFGIREQRTRDRRDNARRQAEDVRNSNAHQIVYGIVTLIPKTGETVDLLDRKLFDDADLAAVRDQFKDRAAGRRPPTPVASPTRTAATQPDEAQEVSAEEDRREAEMQRQVATEAQEETERAARSRSIPWIVGTSVGFEAVVLGIAAWIFCRRDY